MLTQPNHNPNAVRADILNGLDLAAHAAENQGRIHRLLGGAINAGRAAHHDQVAIVTRRLRAVADRGLLDQVAAAAAENDDSYQTTYAAQYAWHTIRLYRGQAPLDPGECNLVDETHPFQCGTLPLGAMCWFTNDPRRHRWPAATAHGIYRLRPTFYLHGQGDGDPDVIEDLDIQVLDEATAAWADWRPPTAGTAADGTL